MADVQHETVFYSGRVQGVGFRYQTLQAAKGFEVAGYVCNLPDGRVQLEVEGTRAEVDAFLEAVGTQMEGYIRKAERSGHQRPAQFKGFSIR
jgi:acylphosphatase